MLEAISIILAVILCLPLYHILTHWLSRGNAGTATTFLALASACCVFLFVYLPVEFSGVVLFFLALTIISLPLLHH